MSKWRRFVSDTNGGLVIEYLCILAVLAALVAIAASATDTGTGKIEEAIGYM